VRKSVVPTVLFLFLLFAVQLFSNDLQQIGYLISASPDTNQTLWSFTAVRIDSLAVADGKLYVTTRVTDSYPHGNKIYCLNATTGAEIWNYTKSFTLSSLTIADGKVYIVSSNSKIGSNDNRIYCLNSATGTDILNYTTSFTPYFLTIADGKLYAGSGDGKVYCLNASNGASMWSHTTGAPIYYSSPAVVDGRVYIGSDDGKVYCLNAANGAEIWSYTTGDLRTFSPAVADGKVYVGSLKPVSGREVDNRVYCLDAATGAYIWSYKTGYVSSPWAVADGVVYIISEDYETVIALNAMYTPTTTPSPSIPEFPSWIILPSLVTASAFLIIFKRRVKRK